MNTAEENMIGALFAKLWTGWYTDDKATLVTDLFRPYPFEVVRDCVNTYWRQNPDSFKPKLSDIRAYVQAKSPPVEHRKYWGVDTERSYRADNDNRFINGWTEKTVFEFCRENGIQIPSVADREAVIARMVSNDRMDLQARGRKYEDAAAARQSFLAGERLRVQRLREKSAGQTKRSKLSETIERLKASFSLP